MKKIKGKLAKRSSQNNLHMDPSVEWNKYDERLLECVHQNDVARLKATLTKKAVSVVKLSPNGTTALHTACEKGNGECLEIMMKEKPDLNLVLDRSGRSVLGCAAEEGSIECIMEILRYNSDTIGFQDYHKKTALHYAAAKGHYDCVKLLLENDEYIDVRDKDGRTPLLMGIQSGKEDVVKLFLDRGAKVNITDNSKKTALMYASLLGHEMSVELLLKRGANSNFQDSNGHTAEDYARIIGYKDIITAIKNAPTVATWDAGDDNEEEEEEEEHEIPNGELVSAFNGHEEEEEVNTINHNNSTNTSPESFSSKASTTMSSITMQRDLTNDIKELEEENETMNQELNKLRVQHQKTIERLRITEDELNAFKKNPFPPDVIHVNGRMDNEDLLEKKERRIEELESQISKLKIEMVTETRAKQNAEREIETLNIQLQSFQAKEENRHNSLSDDEFDDLDLPGVDGYQSPQTHKTVKEPSSSILSSLNNEVSMLKIQNQTLKEQLKEHISREINHNDLIDESTIPLPVYQQLKDSSEEEIFSLSEQIEELKIQSEELESKLLDTSENCQKCLEQQKSGQTIVDTRHKIYLESEVQRLRNILKDKETEYKSTISLYRLHLLSSAQGELDAEVNEALQMIINLRASEQFC